MICQYLYLLNFINNLKEEIKMNDLYCWLKDNIDPKKGIDQGDN